MKAILISIKPKWVAKILNGEKTIEVRKSKPKCDLPIDVYIYCTKDNSNGYLYYSFGKTIFHDKYVLIKEYDKQCIIGNGKVVAKFTLNKVGELSCEFHKEPLFDKNSCYQSIRLVDRDYDFPKEDELIEYIDLHASNEEGYNDEEIVKKSKFLQKCCLTLTDIKNYVGNKETLYAWHISNLEIFDKPKELEEFNHWVFYKKCEKCPYGKIEYDYGLCSQCCELKSLTKAPQSYQFIEVVGDK